MEYISCMRLIFKHMLDDCRVLTGKNSWASATIVKIMPTVISCYEYFILDGMRRIESWFWQLDKCEHVLTLTLKLGIFTKYLFFCFLNTSLRLHLKKNVHVTET